MSENCTVFYTVVAAGFTYHSQLTDGSARQIPTPAELMNFTGPGGSQDPSVSGQVVSGFIYVPTANTPVNVTITGLRNATRYWLWLVAGDFKMGIWSNNSQNVQAAATLRPFTTRVNTPPLYKAGYPFAVAGTDSIDVTVNLFNISGYAKYIVVPQFSTYVDAFGNSVVPTTQDVLLATSGGSVPASAGPGNGIQLAAVCGSWDPVLQTSSFVFNDTDVRARPQRAPSARPARPQRAPRAAAESGERCGRGGQSRAASPPRHLSPVSGNLVFRA